MLSNSCILVIRYIYSIGLKKSSKNFDYPQLDSVYKPLKVSMKQTPKLCTIVKIVYVYVIVQNIYSFAVSEPVHLGWSISCMTELQDVTSDTTTNYLTVTCIIAVIDLLNLQKLRICILCIPDSANYVICQVKHFLCAISSHWQVWHTFLTI